MCLQEVCGPWGYMPVSVGSRLRSLDVWSDDYDKPFEVALSGIAGCARLFRATAAPLDTGLGA